ncbi:peptide/nickel transport system substrate-binding protein [Bradyrhizobium sp. i1.15.2]|uniref:ABC transporter substrate-binding protein n=1 Tax=Bradyrhizobium sp. i1.15.2 TaxID=3156362 RepID=UPI003393D7D4
MMHRSCSFSSFLFFKLFRFMLGFVVGSNLLPTFAQAPVRKDIAVFDLTKSIDDPKNFNWFTRGTKREHGAHQAMWEPLFLLDYETGELEPWLAANPMTANGAQDVWTLTLRKDIKWSDGMPFTANDVKFTVEMARDYDTLTAMEAATMRSQVESVAVTAAKPLEAVFKLRKPNPRFALENFGGSLFGSFLIMPAHIWKDAIGKDALGKERDPADFKFQNPIGTGPYKLKDATKTAATWVRDSNWWSLKGGTPPFKKKLPEPLQLEWHVIDTEAQSKTELVSNDNKIDAAREFTLANFTDAKSQNPKIVGWDAAGPLAWNDPCARQIDINAKREPWSNPKLRQALSFAIDRKALAAGAYGNTAVPSRSMFPEYGAMKPFIDAVVNAGFGLPPNADVAKAKALIEGLGYAKAGDFYKKGGQTLSAVITVNGGSPNDVDAAKAVAQQLIPIGIDASVQSIINEQYWGSAVPKGEYEMVFGWLSCGSIAEPYTSMARYAKAAVPIGTRSPGFDNTGRWEGQPQKDYADVVLKEIGPLPLGHAGVPAQVAKAYKFLNDEMPFIPLVQSPRIIPSNTTYWAMWPAKGGSRVPMHSWGAAHRIIHGLKKVP